MYMSPRGDVGECACAKRRCSGSGDASGKVKEKPQKMFPGWETSGLSVSSFLLKSIQTCIIYQDLRGLILRYMVVNQAFIR